jgi:hypothetical protein
MLREPLTGVRSRTQEGCGCCAVKPKYSAITVAIPSKKTVIATM